MNNLCLITWSHSTYSDVWPLYFGQLNKYFSGFKNYLFVNENDNKYNLNCDVVFNKETDSYYQRFVSCLEKVEEEYVLYMQEDFVLYDQVDKEHIKMLCSYLQNSDYSFIRLIKSGVEGGKVISKDLKLYEIPNYSQYLFSHQATIWKKNDLKKLYEWFRPKNLRGAEIFGSQACKYLNIKGCYVYQQEQKRGRNHYDSKVFPYISTAIVKGKWDLQHYSQILLKLLKEYEIDINKRGYIKQELIK